MDDLFDEAELFVLAPEPVRVPRLPSTEETRAPYDEIRKRRIGEVWQEGDRLCRKGPTGVTHFKPFDHPGEWQLRQKENAH